MTIHVVIIPFETDFDTHNDERIATASAAHFTYYYRL